MWILSTCQPTKSFWSIPRSTGWCTEPILQDEWCYSRTENVEVCKGQSGWTVGERIQSVKRTKDSYNPCCNGGSAVWGWNGNYIKRRQFQVGLNRARQVATIWSDADQQRAIEPLEHEIHQVTPAQRNLLDELFQHSEQQLSQEVGTKATSPRSTFAKKSCSNGDCCRRRGLWGGTHDCQQPCAMSGQYIRCWDWSRHLEYRWYWPHCESAAERDVWYHFERPDEVHEGFLHPLGRVWILVAGNWSSGAPENHRTACTSFRISKDASSEPYIRVNLANGFWGQFHHRYFWTATYPQCERNISIYQQRQLHSTDAQAQWPLYRSGLYGGDTVVACPSRLVPYRLCKYSQPTISCR